MERIQRPGPDLKLFESWMETTRWIMGRTERFPKRLRHSLTDRIDNLALEILEELTSAAYRKDKIATLQRIDDGLNRLRVVLRLCHEMQVLSHGQYEEVAARLAEAGLLLGGWIKQQKRGAPVPRQRPGLEPRRHRAMPSIPGVENHLTRPSDSNDTWRG